MSYIHVDRSKTIAAPVIYVVYGSVEAAKEGQVRAAQVTAVSAGGLRSDEWAGMDFIDEGNELLRPHKHRSNKCLTYIQSWPACEFDKNNPKDVQRAHDLGVETARRLAPNSPFIVATHIDSKGGCVHNHIIILNHDYLTGKAAPKEAGNFHNVKRVNDELMDEVGMEVLQPSGSWVRLRQAERAAVKAGISTDSTGLGLDELDGYTWADCLRKRVDALLKDERVSGASGADEGLKTAREIASEYDLSLVVNEHNALTVGLVDESGETLTYESGVKRKRTRRAVDAGSKFGAGYSLEGIQQRIAEQQQLYALEVQRQARLAGLLTITEEIGEVDDVQEIAATTTISSRNRAAGLGFDGAADRSRGDAGEVAEIDGREAEGIGADASEFGAADRESGPTREGTAAFAAAAERAKAAAADFGANNSRDERVRQGAEESSGDNRGHHLNVDEHGAGHESNSADTVGIESDVPSDAGGSKASRAAIEKRRRERQRRLRAAIEIEPEIGD
ncbi:relaxase/mobilization nuclease domain-containing protein [Corynebacterium sp. HMSC074E01]|uniref:relaxase/mobilization nuclease domain-containing protein n=1 Tax=Corynebacterium sp. HMSC074E01 TaxID=1715017 RepID=UPI0009F5C88B|nr:relaxase/mobilization nuclease domain-containing protein [Corynebacterium sp. HMSC074E01]